MSMLKSHSLTFTLSHSHNVSLSHSHSFTLSFTHSPHAEQLLFSCLCSKAHSHALTLSRSHILSFTLSRHAEQLLFSCLGSKVAVYSRKLQCFFLTSTASPSPVTLDVIELVPSEKHARKSCTLLLQFFSFQVQWPNRHS